MKAEARVTKHGPGGVPLVQVAVGSKATPEHIADAIRATYSNPEIYNAGGLRPCLTCKSGIRVEVVEDFGDAVKVTLAK